MANTIQIPAPGDTTMPPQRAWKSLLREKSSLWPGADQILGAVTRGSAIIILLMLVSLLWVLSRAALPSIKAYGWSFVTSSDWRPNELERPKRSSDGKVIMEDGQVVMETLPAQFGAWPVIWGTAASSVIALVLATPLGIGAALFLVRVAPKLGVAKPISFLIEFLAAIPSIAYGIWGLFVLAPFLQEHLEPWLLRCLGGVNGFHWLFNTTITSGTVTVERAIALTGRDMLSAGLILAVMVLPIITAVSRDILAAVPSTQIEGTLALGATWWQSCRAMLHYSRSGLFGAVMLGLARAAGETMAVTMVIGNSFQVCLSPLAPAQTMSSLLANEFAEANSELHRSALTEVALILLVMSLAFNIVARYLVVGGQARQSGK